MQIKNPVLTGFNPDPCILAAKGKYYIATSTFEYYPGVQIFESADLVNWEVVARPIDDEREDRRGLTQGGGVWAPCLSYDGKRFYLVYSKVTSWSIEPFKDVDNYVITADSVKGEWSEPTYINSDGFDASLFHDGDKSYYMSVNWDYRKAVGASQFAGILLWEFDRQTLKRVGKPVNIFKGTDRGLVEAPHIYKEGEYYYLITAEGGTKEEHAATVARSKNVFGPYELHPLKHLITSLGTDNPLQKAGHGSLCKDGEGNYYFAHLCGRKLFNGCCVLGRETCIQNVVFKDGWPYLENGTTEPSAYYTVPYEVVKEENKGGVIEFNGYTLKNVYQSLRAPINDRMEVLSSRTIRLRGAETIVSTQKQTALLVRQAHYKFEASFKMKFSPENYKEVAGLLYRYDEADQYLFYVTFDEQTKGNVLNVFKIHGKDFEYIPLNVNVGEEVYLKVKADQNGGTFYYSEDGSKYIPVYRDFDVWFLSDEGASPMGFTGAFVGMYVGDYSNRERCAEFTDFTYFNEEGDQ